MLMVYWKLKIKAQAMIKQIFIVCGFLIIFALILSLKVSKFEIINQFGLIKVNGYLPSFIGFSQSGKKIGSIYPKGGNFYIHVIDEQLPISCLDLECGWQAKMVLNKGGHLIGGSDFKYARIFGIKIVKNRSLTQRVLYRIYPVIKRLGWKISIHHWKLETSLVVIANKKGRIIRIYKNAGIKDIPRIINDLEIYENNLK